MDGSVERTRAVINGRKPDRAPMFDLLRNDAVLSHFSGEKLELENAKRVVYKAFAPAIDSTRPNVRVPHKEESLELPDGRKQERFRWTTWTEHVQYRDAEHYAKAKQEILASFDPAWNDEYQSQLDAFMQKFREMKAMLGELFFVASGWIPGFMSITGEIGLEQFSYFLADCPAVIDAQLDINTERAVQFISHLPADHGIEAVFVGDDIAFHSGPFLSPAWFSEHYFPLLTRITDAYHRRGIKVLFHSDGNLNPVMDGLVAAGIDGLNPIEILAGMDIADLHRRYPDLFMAGGIDVSQLLPFGTAQQVKDAVYKAIDDAEGRLMVGSTTELNNEVPLENFLAMREAVLETSY